MIQLHRVNNPACLSTGRRGWMGAFSEDGGGPDIFELSYCVSPFVSHINYDLKFRLLAAP